MIKVNGYKIVPTLFPDGTSQIWKLPKRILDAKDIFIIWNWDNESEVFHIRSLAKLLWNKDRNRKMNIYIPYFPYARQDKEITNETTFNLRVFCGILDMCFFKNVFSFDIHNPLLTDSLLFGFMNIAPHRLHKKLIFKIKPDCIVFPDIGARSRYLTHGLDQIVFNKKRDQKTGKIIGHCIDYKNSSIAPKVKSFLIVDDICDGGATFLSVAKELKKLNPKCKISLFVSHGIFSRGTYILRRAGISIYTTNSLLKNNNIKGVLKI